MNAVLKLCFNATTLRYMDIFEALRHIKEAGYEAVEIALNDTHIHPYKSSPERLRDVRKYCEDIGLVIACVAAGGPTFLAETPYEPSMIWADAAGRRQRLDAYKSAIELAHEVGSPILNINSGILKPGVSAAQADQYFREGMEELLGAAGDITLVLEQEPGFFVGTTETALKYIQEFDTPKLRFNLDIGHVFCCEPEDECYDNVERSLPYTRHIHVEDIKNRVHHHEIPGEGDIDFGRIVKLIEDSGYEHYVCVELHNHDQMWERALKESRDYLIEKMSKD